MRLMTLLHFHTALPVPTGDTPPEWIHLLPAGEFRGVDGRGPYHVENADALIRHSMQGGNLVLDENHATDHALVSGGSAPAAGWITELQNREDGMWGRVDWTPLGQKLYSNRSYRGISPAFAARDGVVGQIVRASLTNAPNLTLTSLHTQETGMDLAEIARRLGLPASATEADVLGTADSFLSLRTQAVQIAGLSGKPSLDAVITGLKARTSQVEMHTQSVATMQAKINDLQDQLARRTAEAAIDEAGRTRIIPEGLRKTLITLHMRSPEEAEAIISGLQNVPDGSVVLHTQKAPPAEQTNVLFARMDEALGLMEAK
ncbi:MAG: hypothetical protein GX413_13735 [Acetobacter sp.]|nr:hypothetical protein [Acetobacter sp.]